MAKANVEIVAELGSNPAAYHWNFEPWCRAASLAKATAVKVQLFRAAHFPEAEQPAKRRLEFPRQSLAEFVEIAHRHGLRAGASVFDAEAVELAAQHCDFLKLAAREQENGPLIADAMMAAVVSGKTVYRSISDMCYERIFLSSFHVPLFTIQRYPSGTVISLIGLFRIWHEWRGTVWGWSSHTRSALDCIVAARLGALVIEKHLAMSPNDIEAGHSLQVAEFRKMAKRINGTKADSVSKKGY